MAFVLWRVHLNGHPSGQKRARFALGLDGMTISARASAVPPWKVSRKGAAVGADDRGQGRDDVPIFFDQGRGLQLEKLLHCDELFDGRATVQG